MLGRVADPDSEFSGSHTGCRDHNVDGRDFPNDSAGRGNIHDITDARAEDAHEQPFARSLRQRRKPVLRSRDRSQVRDRELRQRRSRAQQQ
jgi:hypothetical protein